MKTSFARGFLSAVALCSIATQGMAEDGPIEEQSNDQLREYEGLLLKFPLAIDGTTDWEHPAELERKLLPEIEALIDRVNQDDDPDEPFVEIPDDTWAQWAPPDLNDIQADELEFVELIINGQPEGINIRDLIGEGEVLRQFEILTKQNPSQLLGISE